MRVRVVSVGDNVVDCYPGHGQMFPGGNTLNVSVFARRTGAETGYVGAIGEDGAGAAIRRALDDEAVDLSRLRTVDGATAHCMIGHQEGDRVFMSFDAGVSMFELDDDDLAFIGTFDAAHIGQSSGLDQALAGVSAKTRLSYDFSNRRDAEHLAAVAPLCYLASFSGGGLPEEESAQLARSAIAEGATWALVTRGTDGALLVGPPGLYVVPASPTEVVDTLGAGDTFVARALVGLLRAEHPDSLLKDAARLAAITCTRLGAFGHGTTISANILPPEPSISSTRN